MINQVSQLLDQWIQEENQRASQEGFIPISKVGVYIVGQTALLEANLSIDIVATMDVDCKKILDHKVTQKFDELLKSVGKHLDPIGHEAWMPEETEYRRVYQGQMLTTFIAEPVYVILSKAKVDPIKNKNLILDYLASGDLDNKIFGLARKYLVDLDQI